MKYNLFIKKFIKCFLLLLLLAFDVLADLSSALAMATEDVLSRVDVKKSFDFISFCFNY